MIALEEQDLLLLSLGLDCLRRYTANELAAARKDGNRAKVAAMQSMQEQIRDVRTKVIAMQAQSAD